MAPGPEHLLRPQPAAPAAGAAALFSGVRISLHGSALFTEPFGLVLQHAGEHFPDLSTI